MAEILDRENTIRSLSAVITLPSYFVTISKKNNLWPDNLDENETFQAFLEICTDLIMSENQRNKKQAKIYLTEFLQNLSTVNDNYLFKKAHPKNYTQTPLDILLNDALDLIQKKTPDIDVTHLFADSTLFFLYGDPRQQQAKKENHLWKALSDKKFPVSKKSMMCRDIWRVAVEHGTPGDIALLLDRKFQLTGTLGPQENMSDILFAVSSRKAAQNIALIPSEQLKPLVNIANWRSETPLHHAARQILPEYVSLLLDLGADPKIKTKSGKLPLDLLKRTNGRTAKIGQVVSLLGGETGRDPKELFLQGLTANSTPLLRLAKEAGGNIKKLAEEAELYFTYFSRKNSGTINSLRKFQQTSVAFFLEEGADLRLQKSSYTKETMLHGAVSDGARDIVALLLDAYPELAGERDIKGKRAAELTTRYCYRHTAATSFYARGEEVSAAQAKNQLNIAKLFIEKGCSVLDSDFPTARQNPETKASLEKIMLNQALGDKVGITKRNMRKI